MRTRTLIAAGMAALSLVAAGCGDEKTVDTSGNNESAEEAPAADESAADPTATTGEPSAELKSKPKITVPKGDPPTKLVTKDIIVGKGAPVKAGDNIAVNYVGVAYSNGKEFDNSYDRGQPFQLQLGGGQVIPGWDQGIVGMKVGGRRELVIPAELAYGAQGSPPTIKPNETLIFNVDLLAKQ
jgi:peptidylprolyl isomerase